MLAPNFRELFLQVQKAEIKGLPFVVPAPIVKKKYKPTTNRITFCEMVRREFPDADIELHREGINNYRVRLNSNSGWVSKGAKPSEAWKGAWLSIQQKVRR